MAAPQEHEERRVRYQGWLQTAAFLGAAAVLALVVYTSVLVQQNRRALERAATATAQTLAAVTASPPATLILQNIAPQKVDVFRSTPLPAGMEPIVPGNAGRVEEVARWWGQGTLNTVAWSPGGSVLAVGTTLGVSLFDARTLQELRFLDTGGAVSAMAFSSDGQVLVVISSVYRVQLWHVADGTLKWTLERGVNSPYAAVAQTPEGELVLAWKMPNSGFYQVSRTATATNTTSAGAFKEFSTSLSGSNPGETGPFAVALSPDGRLVAFGAPDGQIDLRGATDLKLVATLTAGSSLPQQLVFSPNGRLLAAAFSGSGVRVWETAGGELLYTLEEGMSGFFSLSFSADGRTLAVAGSRTVRLYGMDTGAFVHLVEISGEDGATSSPASVLPESPIVASAFSPDGQTLALGLAEGWLSLVQVEDGALLQSRLAFAPPWGGLALSPDGALLAVRSLLDGTTWLWDVADGVLLRTLRSEYPYDGARTGAFSPDGRLLASADGVGVVLWQVADGTIAGQLLPGAAELGQGPAIPEDDPALCVAFSPDGRWVAAGYAEGQLLLWRLPAGTLRWWTDAYDPRAGAAWCDLSFSPGGQFLAASWLTGSGYLWHVPDGALVYEWKESRGWPIMGLAFSPDGGLVASWTMDGYVYLRRTADGEVQRALQAPAEAGVGLAFSPDGQLLAGGSVEGPIYLWQVSAGTLLRTLEGHTSWVSGLAFSPDGRVLFSASPDASVRVWGARR